MKKYIIVIFLLIDVLTVCGRQKNEINKGNQPIVVIVHYSPNLPDTVNVAPRMSYITGGLQFSVWDTYQKTMYKPHTNVTDTFVIQIQGNSAIVMYEYGYYHSAQATVLPGDELHINYQNEIPVFSIANKLNRQYDGNLHILLDSLVYYNQQFSNLNTFTAYNFVANALVKKGLVKTPKPWAEYGQLALKDLQREQTIIDSLLQLDQLSSDIHAIYTDRILFQQYIIRLRLGQHTQAYAQKLMDSLRQVPEGKPYSYYTQFCEDYVNKFIVGKLPLIKGAGFVIVDYRRAYDSVKLFARPLHKGIQSQLLFKQLELIAQNFPSADLARYLTDYKLTTGDTASANIMASAYLMDLEPLRQLADSVYLLSSTQQKTTLDAILKANRGKVVFVDCWASWCLPCIEAMPYTQKLQDNYGDKGLTVLFLSFDRKKDDWLKANDKHGLRFFKNNFMVVNPAMSAYMKKLKVSSLPRYLLFDKKGQLVNANAQDAKSKLTLTAISSLLKQ